MMRLAVALSALALAGCSPAAPQNEPRLSSESSPVAATRHGEGAGRAPQTPARSADCSQSEATIFACKVSGGKTLAVCGTGDGAEYRIGRDRAELVLQGGEWAKAAYSGGGEAQIRFTNGSVQYVVFSRMVRTNFTEGEPNYPAISDGVVVLKNGAVEALLMCDDPDAMPVQYAAAENLLSQREQLFTDETILADERR